MKRGLKYGGILAIVLLLGLVYEYQSSLFAIEKGKAAQACALTGLSFESDPKLTEDSPVERLQ